MNKKSSNFVKKWTKFQTKAQKCSKVHFIREIWWKTWRLPGKPGELAGMQQETPQKIWVISKLYKYFTVLFLSSRNSSVSLPSINGQSGTENLMSSSSSKRPSSDGKRKTTASSKQKINRVSDFLFKSHSHQVIIHCGHHTAHLIGCNKKSEIVWYFQGWLFNKIGLLHNKLCNFFRAN